jgi:hypothetical protein
MLPLSLMFGWIQGPVSLTTDQVMLFTVNKLSPRLLKSEDWVVPPTCPPTTTLKDTVLGAIAISGFFELAVPFKVMGTELEYLATLFVVLTMISLDNKPTVEGPKVAFRLNV